MNYKCNKCKKEFCLTEQTRWSVYCFSCDGILNFMSFEKNELTEDELMRCRKR